MATDVVKASETEGPKNLDVFPLKKGKRVLCFLADYFIMFVLALILFHLAAYPLGKVIVDSQGQYETYLKDAYQRDNVLYGNGLLFYEEGKTDRSVDNYTVNLAYTAQRFISYYVVDADASNEIFSHYETLTSGAFKRLAIYRELNEKHPFFDIAENGTVALKSQYVEEFAPIFRPGDAMSSKGQADYETFRDDFFLQCYSTMLQDINSRDLTYNGVSYVEYQKKVDTYNAQATALIVTCAVIAYAIAWLVDYMLFPLVTRNHKTLGMFFLRDERISSEKLNVIKKSKVPLVAIYGLAFSVSSIMFVPWGATGFNELFSLPLLLPLSIVSLVLSVVSLAFLLFDDFGRSLGDRLSFTVMVDEATLGEILRAKGYDF